MAELILSPQGVAFIARFEGFRASVYTCPAGKKTIGYGHVILPDDDLPNPISQAVALDLLARDARREVAPVEKSLVMALAPHQADALISLAFNCGGRAIAHSTLLRRINNSHIADAAEQFLLWNKIGRAESRGLTRRRLAEKQLFLNGEYGL